MHVRSWTLATSVLVATLALAPPTLAAGGENRCYTTVLFGYHELVVMPVLGNAVGIVVGTPLLASGAGATILVRPQACGLGGSLSSGTVQSSTAPGALPSADSILPILP